MTESEHICEAGRAIASETGKATARHVRSFAVPIRSQRRGRSATCVRIGESRNAGVKMESRCRSAPHGRGQAGVRRCEPSSELRRVRSLLGESGLQRSAILSTLFGPHFSRASKSETGRACGARRRQMASAGPQARPESWIRSPRPIHQSPSRAGLPAP